jgi:hypothetical protein
MVYFSRILGKSNAYTNASKLAIEYKVFDYKGEFPGCSVQV